MISPRILADSLMTLSHVPNAEAAEAETIIMETLFDAHHPCIGIFFCLYQKKESVVERNVCKKRRVQSPAWLRCLSCYVSAHHNSAAWTDIAASFKIDAADFIKAHVEDIFNDIKNCPVVTEVLSNVHCLRHKFCCCFPLLIYCKFDWLQICVANLTDGSQHHSHSHTGSS